MFTTSMSYTTSTNRFFFILLDFHGFSILTSRGLVLFPELKVNHNCLPAHAFNINLNTFPRCHRYDEIQICSFCHIFFIVLFFTEIISLHNSLFFPIKFLFLFSMSFLPILYIILLPSFTSLGSIFNFCLF